MLIVLISTPVEEIDDKHPATSNLNILIINTNTILNIMLISVN